MDTQPPFFPVPVHQRHDGWTPERQWTFIETLARTASVTQAARSVGMNVRSAHRLRQYPKAEAFRAAWDAAVRQAWGLLEQVALDRVINGEQETIERDGYNVGMRHKPCSDRLLIHLLAVRERTQDRARADRAEAHKLAMAEARLAAIRARSEGIGRKGKSRAPSLPDSPVLLDDGGADTAALHALRAHAAAFGDLPGMEEPELPRAPAPWCEGEPTLRPANGIAVQRELGPVLWSPPPEYEPQPNYATRLRWEDFVDPPAAAAESRKHHSG